MANPYRFKIGNLVKSTKYTYLVKNRGIVPEGQGMSSATDGRPGYHMFNLKTKAEYWVTITLAHERYKLEVNTKAGQVLFS